MRIVVCVKHVPDVQSERALDDDGRTVRGLDDVLNELDENAVEAAVSLVEAHGGEVVALTMGPDDAEDAVRRALQMGADRGVHVSDDALAGADVVTTARVLAAAVRAVGPVDLVVTGMAALDGLTSMLPTALAAELGLPQLTLATELSVTGGGVRVRRDIGDAVEVLESPLPALVSVTDQANEPRYPAFKAIRAARKKPVDTWSLADLGLADATPATTVLSAEPRAAREQGRIVTDSGDGGRQLAEFLIESRLV
ncbi:electron transfer flavoprotein subunit beta/FixA family protein [Georgenia sp. 311]|uniref:Electron transfer flavoprotein subunit beta n=1 Tax=Georgenia wutianyii TaxID=2585135 RepID=A0ABX5VNH0_9MICO|nr:MULTISPECIES: electron transfer flavoprotein subunit beta/FixA family protein [Georgenia]QDB80032.1 electron transfer flavoprotein subunit beta/FixA family protein [Georgenia wutianyii]TNC19800.1 electron transfer flavoprotein subunit beta/FixA family protein [Georgenia sp. 311]